MKAARVVNTQWLFREPAIIIGETKHQYIASYGGARPARYWKKNGYQLGFSRLLRSGNEPDRLEIEL